MLILMTMLLACDEFLEEVRSDDSDDSDNSDDDLSLDGGQEGEDENGIDTGDPDSTASNRVQVDVIVPLSGLACWITDIETTSLVRVSLETGEILDEIAYDGPIPYNGMGRLGDEMLLPGGSEWALLDLNSGEVSSLGAPSGPTTASSDGTYWYTLVSRSVMLHSSAETLTTSGGDAVVSSDFTDSRMAAYDGFLYGAWHSTNHVTEHDLVAGTTRDISLEGYDTWVGGISVTESALHLIDNGRNGHAPFWFERLVSFDRETGSIIGELQFRNGFHQGLWCEPL